MSDFKNKEEKREYLTKLLPLYEALGIELTEKDKEEIVNKKPDENYLFANAAFDSDKIRGERSKKARKVSKGIDGRIRTAMYKTEDTPEAVEYNNMLDDLSKTPEGQYTMLKIAAKEILSYDLNSLKATTDEEAIKVYAKHNRMAGLLGITGNIIGALKNLKGDNKIDPVLIQALDDRRKNYGEALLAALKGITQVYGDKLSSVVTNAVDLEKVSEIIVKKEVKNKFAKEDRDNDGIVSAITAYANAYKMGYSCMEKVNEAYKLTVKEYSHEFKKKINDIINYPLKATEVLNGKAYKNLVDAHGGFVKDDEYIVPGLNYFATNKEGKKGVFSVDADNNYVELDATKIKHPFDAAKEKNEMLEKAVMSMDYKSFKKLHGDDAQKTFDAIKNGIDDISKARGYDNDKVLLDKIVKFESLPDDKREYRTNEDIKLFAAKNPSISYRNMLAYNDMAKRNVFYNIRNDEPEKRAEKAFYELKKSFLESSQKMEKLKLHASGNLEKTDKTNFYIASMKDNLFEINALLRDGDRKLRGSSAEYKDIQKELNDLYNSFEKNTPENHRTTIENIKAISEKAKMYVEKRHKQELKYPVDSYKGRRIANMRKAIARMDAILEYVREKKIEYLEKDVLDSNKKLREDFKNHTFSMSRFQSIAKVVNGGEEVNIPDNIKDAMHRILDGKTASFKQTELVRKDLIKFEKTLSKVKNIAEFKKLDLAAINMKRTETSLIELLDNPIVDKHYAGYVTGKADIDDALLEFKQTALENYGEKLERKAEKEVQKSRTLGNKAL